MGRKKKQGIGVQGLCLHAKGWGKWWIHDAPKSFAVNAILQVKRCHYYENGTRPQKCPKSDPVSVWRTFTTTPHQQLALERLADALTVNNNVLADVSYAAPAFHKRTDLWSHTKAGRLVENSTFPLATELKGHKRWAYSQAGAKGIGLSEPEMKEGKPWMERIRDLSQTFEVNHEGLNQLRCLRQALADAMSPSEFVSSKATWAQEEARLAAEIAANVASLGAVWLVVGPDWRASPDSSR